MPMKASLALLFGLVIAIGACWWFAKERRVSVGMLSPKVFYLCYSSIDPEFPTMRGSSYFRWCELSLAVESEQFFACRK